MGKGEIARNEQFLFFPHCFLTCKETLRHYHQIQNCPQTLSESKLVVWERVKIKSRSLFYGWGNLRFHKSVFHIPGPCTMRVCFNAFANRIDSCQPAQTDLARKFVIVVFYDSDEERLFLGRDFLKTRGPQYPTLGPDTEARFNTFFFLFHT